MGPSPWMQVLTPQRIEQISSFPHTQMMVSPLHERRCRVHESCCLHQFLSAVPYYRRILLGFIFSTQWLLVCGFLPEVYQFNHWTPREFYLSGVDDWVTPDLFSHAQFEDSPERINLSVGPQTGSSLIDIYHGLATNSPKDHPERSVQHQSESKGEQRGRYKERVASVIAGYPSDLDHDNRRGEYINILLDLFELLWLNDRVKIFIISCASVCVRDVTACSNFTVRRSTFRCCAASTGEKTGL